MDNEKDYKAHFNKLIKPYRNVKRELNKSFENLFLERLKELQVTQSRAEAILGIEKKSLNSILSKKAKRVDIVTIIKLAQFLDIEVEDLISIHLQEMTADKIGQIEKTKKSSYIVDNFDIAQLVKDKFLSTKTDYKIIEKRILKFFGFDNIFNFTEDELTPAFSKIKRSGSDLMKEFWVRSAYAQFENINNPNDFNRDALIELIPKIRPYTKNIENGLLTVVRALYSAGLTVIFQPMLTNVAVRGATMVVNGKPCIVITDYGKRYPTLWFALMHEIHHVLYDFEEIAKRRYHITGDQNLFLIQEDKADDFSREYLFSVDKSKYIESFINEEMLVRQYADKCQVHPSIIYNFYCYDKYKLGNNAIWAKYNHKMPSIESALRELNINPWEKETLQENAETLKAKIFNV